LREITASVAWSVISMASFSSSLRSSASLRRPRFARLFMVPTAQAAHPGRVLVGEAFRPHEDERLALLVGQLLERAAEVGQREAAVMARLLGDLLGQDAFGIRHLAAGLAAFGIEGVAQDREQPGAHVGAGLELVDVGPRLDHRVLHEIVCPRDVAGERQGEGAHRLEMRHDLVLGIGRPRLARFGERRHCASPSPRSLRRSSANRSGMSSSTMSS
jgi:hypothetical protein